jgi:hypothetical protein
MGKKEPSTFTEQRSLVILNEKKNILAALETMKINSRWKLVSDPK